MYQNIYKIVENKLIAKDVYKMILDGDTFNILKAGQFVNIKIDGFALRRPISICDYDNKSITIIYKVLGEGTDVLSKMKSGEKLDILVGLGNGYNIDIIENKKDVLLVGGGVGVPPLYRLAKDIKAKYNGINVSVILGFNTKDEIFYFDEFKNIGVDIYVTTMDGSVGIKGLVTDKMKELNYDYFYACGPMVMLKAIYDITKVSGQFSFEERMGCGFGVCMGCSIKVKGGFKRVCKDGPVFVKEEILWND